MNAAASVDVQQLIDTQPFRSYHFRIVGLCAASVMMDGFDAQAMGFVAPALVDQWHITRAALSPILSSGLAGMLLGALFFGPLADRVGRKPILILCTFWFGLCSLLTVRVTTVQEMLILRFITGFGLGGCLPNAIALTSEYIPKRLRATGVMLMFSGFSIGAALGGLVAAGWISRFGWQFVFLVGGTVPCVIGLLLFSLPESARFLVLKGGSMDRVVKYLRQIDPTANIPSGAKFIVSEEERHTGFTVKQLFAHGRAVVTMLLWVIFFMSLLEIYFLNSWLPTVLRDSGLPLSTANVITAMFQVGGSVGVIILGRIFDKMKSYKALAWVFLGASLTVCLIGSVGSSVILQTAAVFLAGVCVVGAQTSSNSMAADTYPTAIRSTGVGWALGIGRIGSIVGPVVGGLLLSSQIQMRQVFFVAAIPPLIAFGCAVMVNSWRTRTASALDTGKLT